MDASWLATADVTVDTSTLLLRDTFASVVTEVTNVLFPAIAVDGAVTATTLVLVADANAVTDSVPNTSRAKAYATSSVVLPLNDGRSTPDNTGWYSSSDSTTRLDSAPVSSTP